MQSATREQSTTVNDVQETVTLTEAQLDLVVGTGVGTSGSGGPVQGTGQSGTG